MKIKIAYIFLISALIIVFTYCQSSTEPGESFKDPREMIWTVDTLTYPGSNQVTLGSIWGSSTTDVYACGHNELNSGQFWHYDGNEWKSIDLFQYVERRSWILQKVFGFGTNDYWVVGGTDKTNIGYNYFKESLVLQNNGSWKDHNLHYETWLMDITGTSDSDIWTCGRDGLVLHFNGSWWNVDTVRIKKFPGDTDYVLAGIALYNNEIIMIARTAYESIPRREQYYIRGTMRKWQIMDSTIFTESNWNDDEQWGNLGLYQSDSHKIYSFGNGGVWSLNPNNNAWSQILKNNYVIEGLFGVSDNYLFAVAAFGQIWFYNGATWVSLSNLVESQNRIHFFDGWTDGEEVFLVGIYGNKTYILHGK